MHFMSGFLLLCLVGVMLFSVGQAALEFEKVDIGTFYPGNSIYLDLFTYYIHSFQFLNRRILDLLDAISTMAQKHGIARSS